MTAKVILNPYAGRWKALQQKQEVETALKTAGVDYELVQTGGPGEGTRLAKDAVVQGFSPIIAAGGDGSINEVMNGMKQVEGDIPPLGLLPLGSANDLADNLGIPKDMFTAARVIAESNVRKIDLGTVNSRYFDNNAAIGLEPYITLIQQRMVRLRGTLRYLAATIRGVMHNPQWEMHITWDGGEYQGRVTLVTVGNCPRTGGLFYVTPHADPFDGLLTFVYGYMPTRLDILRLLPRTMKSGVGNYVENPNIHEVDTTWLKVHVNPPTPMHADGEIQSRAIQDLEYRVFPGALPILLPK
jgi:diacylglycerol kinase (ATP)